VETKINIHSVRVSKEDAEIFECHYPSCGFVGSLSDGIKHAVENQFRVESPKFSSAHPTHSRKF